MLVQRTFHRCVSDRQFLTIPVFFHIGFIFCEFAEGSFPYTMCFRGGIDFNATANTLDVRSA